MAAATDNVGLFFGEDVFLALGAVSLIQGFYASNGIALEPLQIALWALPTAIAAFIIHSIRIVLFRQKLNRGLLNRGRIDQSFAADTSVAGTPDAAD